MVLDEIAFPLTFPFWPFPIRTLPPCRALVVTVVSNRSVHKQLLIAVVFALCVLSGCKKPQASVEPRPQNKRAQLDEALQLAARRGDTASVERLLQQGANVNSRDAHESTPLALAADFGRSETARLLLARGADPVAAGLKGDEALKEAAEESNAVKVALVMEQGVTPMAANDALFAFADWAPPLLRYSVSEPNPAKASEEPSRAGISDAETVKLLLDHGASLDSRDEQGDTPLIRAAMFGHTTAVHLFLKLRARVEARNKNGDTALVAAACECAIIDMAETLESMRLLLQGGANINASDNNGRTALMEAATMGRIANMRLLLDWGADVNANDKDGNTALMVSAGAGPYSAVGATYSVEPVKLLLARGADIEAQDKHGDTALMFAAPGSGYDDPAMVKVLLRGGANVFVKDDRGNTPLDLALKYHRRKIASLLQKAMAAKQDGATHSVPCPSARTASCCFLRCTNT